MLELSASFVTYTSTYLPHWHGLNTHNLRHPHRWIACQTQDYRHGTRQLLPPQLAINHLKHSDRVKDTKTLWPTPYFPPDFKTITPNPDNVYANNLSHEKAIYERLHNIPGIANYLGATKDGLVLEYYPQGNLENYIK
jgi:hypothetical protein